MSLRKLTWLWDCILSTICHTRARIVKETYPNEPCVNEDLVFEKGEDEFLIPANALHKWKFVCNNEHEPIWFFTTAERCKKMVSDSVGRRKSMVLTSGISTPSL